MLSVLASASVFAADAAGASAPAVSTLLERASILLRSDPEAGRRQAEAALQLLDAGQDADLEIRARLLLCDYQSERDPALAERELAAINALLSRALRAGLRAGALTCEGETFETRGDNSQARRLYEEAVSVATKSNDSEMLAGALFSRGYLLGLQGDFAAGLADLRRSQSLYEAVDLPLHALTAMNSVAILYNRMGDYEEAQHIYTRAVAAQKAAGMRREQAVTLHNLGRAHENLGAWAAARAAFQASLDINRDLGYPRGEAYALRGLAAVANAEGNPRQALETLDRAGALQRQTPDARLRAQIALARGVALHRLGRLSESRAALESAVDVFRSGDAMGELGVAHSELAAVSAELGDWKRAYSAEREAHHATEALLRNQLDQRFATLKVQFDTTTREKENEILTRENAANNLALAQGANLRKLQAAVIVLVALLAVLLASLAIYQRRSTLRMRRLAMTDELTGIPNRRAVLRRMETLAGRPETATYSAVILDIDHFKSINDGLGHPGGDQVLKVVADRLRAVVNEPDFFGRLGGEEFLIVMPGSDAEHAIVKAERLRDAIMQIDARQWFDDDRLITASLGVTTCVAGDTPSTVLKRTDDALYAAKRGGRNCVKVELASEPAAPVAGASIARVK